MYKNTLEMISNETAHLLNICAGAKLKLNQKGESLNMSKGFNVVWEQIKMETRLETRLETKIETYFECGLTPEQIAEKMDMPVEKVEEILKKSEQEMSV
jgi:predicted transposase YdaD